MNSSTNDDIVCTIFGRVFFFILQLVFRNEKYWRPSFFDGGMPTSIRSTEGTRIVYKIHLKWHIKTGFHIFRCSFEAECNAFFVVVVRLCACIFLKIQQFSFFPFLTIRIFVDRCHVFTSLSLSMDVRIVSACLYIYIHVHGYGGVCMCTFPFFSLSLQSSFSFHFFFLLLVTLFFIGLLLHIEIGVSWRYSIFETLLHNVFTEYTFRSLMLVFSASFFTSLQFASSFAF